MIKQGWLKCGYTYLKFIFQAQVGIYKIVAKIKELANLRDNGILTEEEFQLMKAKVLEKF